MKENLNKQRCFGNKEGQDFYAHYHDHEWGIPAHDDQKLFEFLILEGAQAGLNWETILKKRSGYQKAFCNFDPQKVATMGDEDLETLRHDPEIIRNRLKIQSARKNARVFLDIQKEFGSFDRYLWAFVNNKQVRNHWESFKDVPTETPESIALSKDLKKRGMSFVGPTIMYAYMQAVGLVDDHLTTCPCYKSR
ncbi:MAG TPA: DNA-3-methyladenine glycosylase I [Holosporales bacterium]|nr:DNA-3-methyladenine glycosylase I [Holosporales bacterium]